MFIVVTQCQLSVLEVQQMVAPKFVERFQQCTVSEGETVVLQCRAVGTPTPVLSWQKDGGTVENTDNVMVSSYCLDIKNIWTPDARTVCNVFTIIYICAKTL